jgi:hypothetical protein
VIPPPPPESPSARKRSLGLETVPEGKAGLVQDKEKAAQAAGEACAAVPGLVVVKEQQEPCVIDLVPIILTVGVNEMQSLAQKVGSTEYQREINMVNVAIIKSYSEHFTRVTQELLMDASLRAQTVQLAEQVHELETHVAQNAEKNVRILQLGRSLCRVMTGGRAVSCKSAKDRTSMSVTWEQGSLLEENHNVSSDQVNSAIRLMRVQGVRRYNVVKNTGKTIYAFNAFQRSMLPSVLCPLVSTCGGSNVS